MAIPAPHANQPNLFPNEQYLAKADYGYIAALKIANTIFGTKIAAYAKPATAGLANGQALWQKVGRYHFKQLYRNYPTTENEYIRFNLPDTTALGPGTYNFPTYDVNDLDLKGPLYLKQVLSEVEEVANIYGLPMTVLLSAIVKLIQGKMKASGLADYIGDYEDGFLMAKYNPSLVASLWGVRGLPLPLGMNIVNNSVSRQDFKAYKGIGKRRRNGKGKRKKRRY